ncbi:MAG: hypothetical protein KF746_09660 [Chitinophagaceae bacterium]|nr:hypothetical protein [Chitinophagaceae bacterium]
MKKYDYIIIGAGCAGLSLLMRLMDDPGFPAKKVLLIDKEKKENNDRTWCFWEKEKGYFESIVHKSWNDLVVKSESATLSLDLNDYVYKMIRGIDFYGYCFRRIASSGNIEYMQWDVSEVNNLDGQITIITNCGILKAEAGFVFSSVFQAPVKNIRKHYLLQHFKGWLIKTPTEVNPQQALLMDFSVDQKDYPAAFAYVLPLSADRALVEYTVFSAGVLAQEEYDSELRKYIQHALEIQDYSIEHSEHGAIPMTNHRFPLYKNGIFYIGSAGGQTKPSTGYTFHFIQKQAMQLASIIKSGKKNIPGNAKTSSRFQLYDSILLNVLSREKMTGADIFMRLFQRVPAWLIFKFLDNETLLSEEIKILRAMPSRIFLPVAAREIINL